MMMLTTMALLLGAGFAAGSGPNAGAVGSPDELMGAAAPPIAGPTVAGKPFRLAAWLNGSKAGAKKAVVLAFAAIDDDASERTVIQLTKLYGERSAAGVGFVQIGVGKGKKPLGAWVKREGIPWTVLPDFNRRIATRYGVKKAAAVLLLDSDGVVQFVGTEASPSEFASMREKLGQLTGTQAPADTQQRSTVLGFDKKYVFGRPPSLPGAAVRWQPLAMMLGRATNAFITMQGVDSYQEFEKELQQGVYDIVNAGPLAAVEVLDRYEPGVALQRYNKPTYRGILFAAKTSEARQLSDLRGKKLALISERSSSGGVYPFHELLKAGLEPEVDVEIHWVGDHQAVANAVKEGRVDAGGCYDDCRTVAWPHAKDRDTATVVLGYTEDIPTEVILFRRSLSHEAKAAMTEVLLNLSQNDVMLTHMAGPETPITGITAASADLLIRAQKLLEQVKAPMQKAIRLAKEREAAKAEE